MRKTTGALLITAALALSASASAATGARLTFNHPGPKHTFTLRQAHQLDRSYERHQGYGIKNLKCGWVSVHVAGCASKLKIAVIDGQPAQEYRLIDYITRSGPCSNPGPIIKRVGSVTYQDGGHHVGNCFTGPLVVMPHTIY